MGRKECIPPFTPCSRAVSMRSVQTVGSVHAQRARTSPPCVGVTATAEGIGSSASVISHPSSCPSFAPHPLRRFVTTTRALSSRRVSAHDGSSLLHVSARPSVPSPTIRCRPVTALHHLPSPDRLPALRRRLRRVLLPRGYGLRAVLAVSSQHRTETGSSAYGPDVPFLLLSTLPCDNAVTVPYGVQNRSGRDLHPAMQTRSKAH